ncbi:2083_t:CDS:2 [Dentiscutata erythropus]|uniref:2083_t:CDS:1 n=1 Tax=Dentiscutata erythropus TaxID=1348616 RepID=A0A9N8ZIP8_9GLOM|nr:2083_t:CDS:2 [Dentiscutata erythropus]
MKSLSFFILTVVKFGIFLWSILSVRLVQSDIDNFIYTENSNITGKQPFVLGICHYEDNTNTVIIRIGRDNSTGYIRCFEQSLLLRVIQANGSVIEINYDNIEEIQYINYCYVNGNGVFDLLQNGTLNISSDFQISLLGTLDGGYAIIYANTTNNNNMASNYTLAAQFTTNAGLYAIMLGYNQTKINKTIVLNEISTPNVKIKFTALLCTINYLSVATTTAAIPVTTTPVTPFYIKVHFLSTGSVLNVETKFNIPLNNITAIRAVPFGGYALMSYSYNGQVINLNFSLYDDYNNWSNWVFPWQPIVSNLVGAFDILQNNTLLIALNETTTAWNLLLLDLPQLTYNDSGYGNLQVNSTYPLIDSNNLTLNFNYINITYQYPVLFADGILYIYQKTNQSDILRQLIRSKNCNTSECNILDNVVTLYVLNCTFNQPGGQYYIQIEDNFVMSADNKEFIPGITPNTWNFQTDNSTIQSQGSDVGVQGKLRLTINGSLYFQGLNDSKKHEFFTNLTSELVIIIPTKEGRLSSNERNQIDTSSTGSQILISLSINAAKNDGIATATIENDLNLLIQNKESTNISTSSTTKYLDKDYGFREISKNHNNKGVPQIKYGKINFVFCSHISIFTDTFHNKEKITRGLNLFLAFLILFTERDRKFIDWFAKYGKVAISVAVLSGSSIDVLLILKSYFMELDLLNAPFSDKSLKLIFWGSCSDILLADIPQFAIQISYILYSIEIEVILLFSLIASIISILFNILSKLIFIKFKEHSPYLNISQEHNMN